MARLPYLEKSDLKPEDQDLLKREITLHKALVNSPGAARAFSGLGQYIRYGAKLDPRLRELAILQVGWLARSPYEWSHHVKIGYDFGVTDEDIEAIKAETRGEARRSTRWRGWCCARRARSSPGPASATRPSPRCAPRSENDAIVDLTVTASFYCAVVRVLASLEVDVEDSYMPYLRKHPFPV